MSLTSLIKIPEVRKKINYFFPRPFIKIQGDIKSIPISKSYPVISTAVDYLIRFHLKYFFLKVKDNVWVADRFLSHYKDKKLKKYLDNAKFHYSLFLLDGVLSKDLIRASIDLAKIDLFYRSRYYPDNIGKYKRDDIKDLTRVIKNIDFSKFKFVKRCILNPTFGKASRLVGGADADLILDDQIIDIKNTKKLSITREMLNQMIGYYFLGLIGSVKGVWDWRSINKIGFFFSRYDILYSIPIEAIIPNKTIISFKNWFINKAKKYY
jgi:hypothetical protein